MYPQLSAEPQEATVRVKPEPERPTSPAIVRLAPSRRVWPTPSVSLSWPAPCIWPHQQGYVFDRNETFFKIFKICAGFKNTKNSIE